MNTYLIPIKTTLLLFPFIAFLFTFPFAIHQYRKHGYVNKIRVLVLYSFLLFLITAYFLVILPLPETRDIKSLQKPGTRHYQLIPFNFITDFLKETKVDFSNIYTYKYLLKERAFLQAAFNAVLLAPLGVYLRYYFKKDLKKTIFITFFVSLFFELTQLTGLYGIYNAPYRIFDVDDLMLNTLGGILGYLTAPVFTFFLPKSSEIDAGVNLENIRVGIFRRLLAIAIDWFILSIFMSLFKLNDMQFILFLIYYILMTYLTNGKTLGKWVVRIKIKGKTDRITFKEVLKRYIILYLGVFFVNDAFGIIIPILEQYTLIYTLLTIFQFLFNITILMYFLVAIAKRKLFFYEKLSNTKNVVIKNY